MVRSVRSATNPPAAWPTAGDRSVTAMSEVETNRALRPRDPPSTRDGRAHPARRFFIISIIAGGIASLPIFSMRNELFMMSFIEVRM